MNAATREKIILLLLPSALVAVVWWGWFRPAAARKVDAATKSRAADTSRLEAAEKKQRDSGAKLVEVSLKHRAATEKATLSEAELEQQRQREADLGRQLGSLHQEQQQYLVRWESLKQVLAQHEHRSHERLASVFQAQGLTILNEKRADLSTTAGIRWLDELLRKLNQPIESAFPELKGAMDAAAAGKPASRVRPAADEPSNAGKVWIVEFAGAYENVREALIELARDDALFIPLHLGMSDANANLKLRKWTLVIML